VPQATSKIGTPPPAICIAAVAEQPPPEPQKRQISGTRNTDTTKNQISNGRPSFQ
jgi:hypothetical protein